MNEIRGENNILTETLFKIGSKCKTKVYYYLNNYQRKDIDAIQKLSFENKQMLRLLAYRMFPGGTLVTSDRAVEETLHKLQDDSVTLYRPVFEYDGCRCHPDIVVKEGDTIRIYVVSNRIYDADSFQVTYKRSPNRLLKRWSVIVNTLSFTRIVVQSSYPSKDVRISLIMPDGKQSADSFEVRSTFVIDSHRRKVEWKGDGVPTFLTTVPFDDYTAIVDDYVIQTISELKEIITGQVQVFSHPTSICRECEYRIDAADSGFKQCMVNAFGSLDFSQPSVFDLWNFRRINDVLEKGRYYLKDLLVEDLYNRGGELGDSGKRQLLQLQLAGSDQSVLDKGIVERLSAFRSPYQFVDFETALSEIPLMPGRFPGERILFQFSIHSLRTNGEVFHSDFIDLSGRFPSYEAVRQLSQRVDRTGTVFIYSDYENNVLSEIREHLVNDVAPPDDSPDLIQFIDWFCANSVDMLLLVKEYYYHSRMQGSNSIKDVLPAVLSESAYLKKKYSEPYKSGTNFPDSIIWYQKRENGIMDPYDILKEMNEDAKISQGMDAMVAYIDVVSGKVSSEKLQAIRQSLLQYCELDTLAMLMIFEAWLHVVWSIDDWF